MIGAYFYAERSEIMLIKFKKENETLTAFLQGEIDHHTAAFARNEIDTEVGTEGITKLVLDFGGVTFMDSSGIGLVMGRFRNLQPTGATMHITGTSPQIYKIMKLSGIEKLAKLDIGGFKVETNK